MGGGAHRPGRACAGSAVPRHADEHLRHRRLLDPGEAGEIALRDGKVARFGIQDVA